VILCFCEENNSNYNNNNIGYWTNLINQVSENIREVNYPLIILVYPFNDLINFEEIFKKHKDKRTITVLRTMKNDSDENIGSNYSLILSLLWEKDLYLNQKEIKPNKNFSANIFRINNNELTSSINILLSGYARKGKSTFLNLIFNKLIARESPQGFPLTNNINEYSISFSNSNNNLNEIIGGLKIIDSPGFIEGTRDNYDKIKNLINNSIKQAEEILDKLHYFFFFLQPGVNYQNIEDIFDFLNNKVGNKEFKIIFIINRDMPGKDGRPNSTKETLIDLCEQNYNNLIINNGENILEVDLINGNNENNNKINKIFEYIYNDLINDNLYINNPQLIQNISDENQLVNYLHNNSSFYTRISNPNDIINRSRLKSQISINASTLLIISLGFCPIPFIDIPLFLVLLSSMMISIIKLFGFSLINFPFSRYFNSIFESRNAGDIFLRQNQNMNAIDGEGDINRISVQRINPEEPRDSRTRFVFITDFINLIVRGRNSTSLLIKRLSLSLYSICFLRIGILALNGGTDFIPLIGWVIGGIIASIITVPFTKKIGNKTIEFCSNLIRENGILNIIRNQIEGYRYALDYIKKLSLKEKWERNVLIVN